MTLHHLFHPFATLKQLIVTSLGFTAEEADLFIDMPNVIDLLSALNVINADRRYETFTWVHHPLNPTEIIEIFANQETKYELHS